MLYNADGSVMTRTIAADVGLDNVRASDYAATHTATALVATAKKTAHGVRGSALRDMHIVATYNPRTVGSGAAARNDDLLAYLAAGGSTRVGDVFKNTSYRRVDLDWDVARGFYTLHDSAQTPELVVEPVAEIVPVITAEQAAEMLG